MTAAPAHEPAPWRARTAALTARWAEALWRPIKATLDCVTALGWTVVAAGLGGWALAHWLGWGEFAVVAASCLAFFLVGAAFTVGRMRLRVTLEVTPQRVMAGQPSMARFEITNTARSPLLALGVELPVGVVTSSSVALPTGESKLIALWPR